MATLTLTYGTQTVTVDNGYTDSHCLLDGASVVCHALYCSVELAEHLFCHYLVADVADEFSRGESELVSKIDMLNAIFNDETARFSCYSDYCDIFELNDAYEALASF